MDAGFLSCFQWEITHLAAIIKLLLFQHKIHIYAGKKTHKLTLKFTEKS